MWLMTKHGFYSIVEKENGVYHIRSRVRGDLENLVERIPLSEARIVAHGGTDYRYRIVANGGEVLRIMQFLVETIDYKNFKDCIGQTPDQMEKHDAYAAVWEVLYQSLPEDGL